MTRAKIALIGWPALVAATCALIVPPRLLEGAYPTLALAVLAAVAAVVLAAVSPPAAPRSLLVPPTLVALLALMAISAAWSSVPLRTLYDAVTLCSLALVAWLVIRHGGADAALTGVVAFGVLLVLATALNALIDWQGILFDANGGLQGPYSNRNVFGLALALTLPAFLAMTSRRRGTRVLRIGGAVAVSALVALSGSRTALLVAVAVVAGWGILLLLRRSRRAGLSVLLVLGVGLIVAALRWSDVAHLLGRSDTLTGRTEIWEAMLRLVSERPILGHGFFVTWPAASTQNRALGPEGGPMAHAHNEVLGWLSSLGALGLALIVASYVVVYFRLIGRWRSGEGGVVVWGLLTLLALNVRGLAEQAETNQQAWLVFVLVCAGACARRAAPRSIEGDAVHPPRLDGERVSSST